MTFSWLVLALTASILLKRAAGGGGCCCPVCCCPGCVFVSRALGYDGFRRTSILPSSICRPKLREKANIQSNIYLGVKSGSRPLPGFTTLLAALLLIPPEGAPLFCCLLLGLAAVPYTPAVVPGPPTSQLYGEILLGSCVSLASYKTLS